MAPRSYGGEAQQFAHGRFVLMLRPFSDQAAGCAAGDHHRKADSVSWQRAFGGVRVPRGVHRFKTHEDADRWLWRMIARPTS